MDIFTSEEISINLRLYFSLKVVVMLQSCSSNQVLIFLKLSIRANDSEYWCDTCNNCQVQELLWFYSEQITFIVLLVIVVHDKIEWL